MMAAAQTWLTRLGWDKKILLYAGLLSLVPVLAFFASPGEPAPAPPREQIEVDTLIPRGFVLVPIEVQNYEALDSILGRFGVVDLFQGGGSESLNQKLVARNVRLLRAPQNPNHFAILIPEGDVAGILRQGGSFTVVVKRAAQVGTEFVKDKPVKKRKIVYEGD